MVRVRLVLALLPLALAAARNTRATTVVVPDDYASVSAALSAAASGDSIFVRAGVYNVSTSLIGKDVVLFGEADGTVLSGSSSFRILKVGAGVTAATVFERLIFRDGLAPNGAAISVHDGGAITVRRCRFLNNKTSITTGTTYGGAVDIDAGSSAAFDSCSFVNDVATSGDFETCLGGAVHVAGTASMTATLCRFEGCVASGFEGGIGGAVAVEQYGEADVRDCAFRRNTAGYGGALSASSTLTVERCLFANNSGSYGPSALLAGDGVATMAIADNVFVDNDAVAAAAVYVKGPGSLSGNTIAFNGYSSGTDGLFFSGSLSVDRNIVSNNGGNGVTYANPTPSFGCNDVWSNGVANYNGPSGDLTGTDNNISLDPQFCDPALRVLRLIPGSPCAPAPPCGQIGALGVGCTLNVYPPVAEITGVRLLPPCPHPAHLPVRLVFELPRAATVRLEVFDVLGRRIATLENRDYSAGHWESAWDGRSLSGALAGSGVYVAVLTAGATREVQRFVLTR